MVRFPGDRVDLAGSSIPQLNLGDWILTGFDTAHLGDINIGPTGRRGMNSSCLGIPSVVWDQAKVVAKLKEMSDQC